MFFDRYEIQIQEFCLAQALLVPPNVGVLGGWWAAVSILAHASRRQQRRRLVIEVLDWLWSRFSALGSALFPLLQAALCALPLFVIEGKVDGDTVHVSLFGSFGAEGTATDSSLLWILWS